MESIAHSNRQSDIREKIADQNIVININIAYLELCLMIEKSGIWSWNMNFFTLLNTFRRKFYRKRFETIVRNTFCAHSLKAHTRICRQNIYVSMSFASTNHNYNYWRILKNELNYQRCKNSSDRTFIWAGKSQNGKIRVYRIKTIYC